MNKILFIIGCILAVNYASCQPEHSSLKLSVIINDCVIRVEFKNLSTKEQFIPNYTAMAKDTLQGMIVMPMDVIRIDNDTLVLSSNHLRSIAGNKDTLKNYDLAVSHSGANIRVDIMSNTYLLKKTNKQTFFITKCFL